MLATQMLSKKVAPSFLQKKEKVWNELVEKVKSLEERAVQYGAHLERLLQVRESKQWEMSVCCSPFLWDLTNTTASN